MEPRRGDTPRTGECRPYGALGMEGVDPPANLGLTPQAIQIPPCGRETLGIQPLRAAQRCV